MKKILGGKDKACKIYGGKVLYLKVKHLGIVSNCLNCGAVSQGREKDTIQIYTYSEDR